MDSLPAEPPAENTGVSSLFLLQGYLPNPGIEAGKESTCNARDSSSTPGLRRPPEEGNGYPLQYSGLENSKDGGALAGCSHMEPRFLLIVLGYKLESKTNLKEVLKL